MTGEIIEYYQLDARGESKGRCEVIDIVHFITVKFYNLKPLSCDGDMEKLTQAHTEWLESTQLP